METHSVDPVPFLKKYLMLFDETHQVIQEENRGLLAGRMPSRDILNKKEDLLERLSVAVERIRSVRNTPYEKSNALRTVRKQVQDRLMSILLMDRENEKLLLKLTGNRKQEKRPGSYKGTPDQVRRAYFQRLQHATV